MMLAGIPVGPELVREIVRRVDEPTAGVLEQALDREVTVVALTIDERGSILRALDDAPTDGLAELRGVLLREHEWRVREGLV
jgi:hypothetical protein